ncbi:MAG: hypothetical protein ABJE95_35415, partial [Byssovorax sp.]
PTPTNAPRPLGELLRAFLATGAVTVETRFNGRPEALAAVTSLHLGGVLVVRVDPALRVGALEWTEHRRALASCLAPLAPLTRWLSLLKVPDFIARWLSIPALVATFAAGTGLHDVQHRWGWALASVGVSLVLRYALRPLLMRTIRWMVERELAA